MTIGAALRWGADALGASQTAALDARVLLKAAASLDEAGLIVNERQRLSGEARDHFAAMIARRARHEPVAYITGVREFWSLPIAVEPGVLVPRPDSETLVAAVLARRDRNSALQILDLGCGSGALLCALLSECRQARGVGVDIDAGAVSLTARNLESLGLSARGRAVEGDWTAPVKGRFDVIVSNPPYIAETQRGLLPAEVERFENASALFAGADGLAAYRRLASLSPAVLAPGGLIVLEIGFDQAAAAGPLFGAAFPGGRQTVAKDLAGRDRALIIDLEERAR